MLPLDTYTITAVASVCVYFALAWAVMVRAPRRGTILPLYEVPEHLSPASLRYVWKGTFDDRVLWAAVLSLVSKGLATLKSDENGTPPRIAATESSNYPPLPKEEKLLMDEMLSHRTRKGVQINMLDGRTAVIVSRMADLLRRDAMGAWFQENRACLIAGAVLSAIAIVVAARPRWQGEWFVLGISLAVMVPSAFYLPFLLMRIRDLYRATREKLDSQVAGRGAFLFSWVLACVAGLALGFIELGVTFGWPVLGVIALMTALNVSFLHFMRTPTEQGRKVLDEIEGFRLFLKEVDRLSMNRSDAPDEHVGLYEKYLPYAIALEVEQAWGDRFVAMASTFHQAAGLPNIQSHYLGMWNGKPLEIVYVPRSK